MRPTSVAVASLALVLLAGCTGASGPNAAVPSPTPTHTSAVAGAPGSTGPTSSSTTSAPPSPTSTRTTASPSAVQTTPPTVTRTATAVPSRPSTTTTSPTAGPSATSPSPSVTGRVVSRLLTSSPVVALTFDGGSGAQGVESVIATLTREGVPATFFLTGAFADANPSLALRLARLGLVGNHTVSHPHLTQLDDGDVRTQVVSAHTAILRATGKDPHPLFRFPYGESDARTLALVNELGYVAVGWTVDTLGWKGAAEGSRRARWPPGPPPPAPPGRSCSCTWGRLRTAPRSTRTPSPRSSPRPGAPATGSSP